MAKAFCIDRVLPEELEAEARAKTAQEHGLVKPRAFELALVTQKKWKPGRTLRICFLDGDPAVHAKVRSYAEQWLKYANLKFEWVAAPKADIRISFLESGYWSAVGTDALVEQFFRPGEPTMNFEAFSLQTPESEYSRVVLHEFGHALGCIHEHQSPAAGIKWNKEVVYRDLGGPPNNWPKDVVDHNVFNTYDATITQFTQFDKKSIMLYSFPKEWTLDGMEFPSNKELSETDTQFIASRYPASAAAVV
jgi:hypothetical protein